MHRQRLGQDRSYPFARVERRDRVLEHDLDVAPQGAEPWSSPRSSTATSPVVQGAVLFVAAIFVTVNLVVDILYAALDPRIRYE